LSDSIHAASGRIHDAIDASRFALERGGKAALTRRAHRRVFEAKE